MLLLSHIVLRHDHHISIHQYVKLSVACVLAVVFAHCGWCWRCCCHAVCDLFPAAHAGSGALAVGESNKKFDKAQLTAMEQQAPAFIVLDFRCAVMNRQG